MQDEDRKQSGRPSEEETKQSGRSYEEETKQSGGPSKEENKQSGRSYEEETKQSGGSFKEESKQSGRLSEEESLLNFMNSFFFLKDKKDLLLLDENKLKYQQDIMQKLNLITNIQARELAIFLIDDFLSFLCDWNDYLIEYLVFGTRKSGDSFYEKFSMAIEEKNVKNIRLFLICCKLGFKGNFCKQDELYKKAINFLELDKFFIENIEKKNFVNNNIFLFKKIFILSETIWPILGAILLVLIFCYVFEIVFFYKFLKNIILKIKPYIEEII